MHFLYVHRRPHDAGRRYNSSSSDFNRHQRSVSGPVTWRCTVSSAGDRVSACNSRPPARVRLRSVSVSDVMRRRASACNNDTPY